MVDPSNHERRGDQRQPACWARMGDCGFCRPFRARFEGGWTSSCRGWHAFRGLAPPAIGCRPFGACRSAARAAAFGGWHPRLLAAAPSGLAGARRGRRPSVVGTPGYWLPPLRGLPDWRLGVDFAPYSAWPSVFHQGETAALSRATLRRDREERISVEGASNFDLNEKPGQVMRSPPRRFASSTRSGREHRPQGVVSWSAFTGCRHPRPKAGHSACWHCRPTWELPAPAGTCRTAGPTGR